VAVSHGGDHQQSVVFSLGVSKQQYNKHTTPKNTTKGFVSLDCAKISFERL
jgi:hypothetical protein